VRVGRDAAATNCCAVRSRAIRAVTARSII
jgi:hypothetical protein